MVSVLKCTVLMQTLCVLLRCSRRPQPRRRDSTAMWTTTWSLPAARTPTLHARLSAGLPGVPPSMGVSGTCGEITNHQSLFSTWLCPKHTLLVQRQPIMTGLRRSPTAAWRRQRLWRWPPALPEPPFLGPSSPLFLTSSRQLKMVSTPWGGL